MPRSIRVCGENYEKFSKMIYYSKSFLNNYKVR